MKNPYLIYEITHQCNCKCMYCYNVWQDDTAYPKKELSFLEIQKLFDNLLSEISPEKIVLTGGEPLLHPDIIEIVCYLKNKNIKVGIASNGTLLTEDKIKRLIDSGISFFGVSLDTLDPKKYELITGVDLLQHAKKAIMLIKKNKINLSISFMMMKININDLEEIIDLCFAFSVDYISLNRFIPGETGKKNQKKLQMDQPELLKLLSTADKKANTYKIPINVTIPLENCIINHKNYPNLNFGSCTCGKTKWLIDPSGNLRTCEKKATILGNLLKEKFLKLSKSIPAQKFQLDNLKSECTKCYYYNNCGGGCRFLRENIEVEEPVEKKSSGDDFTLF